MWRQSVFERVLNTMLMICPLNERVCFQVMQGSEIGGKEGHWAVGCATEASGQSYGFIQFDNEDFALLGFLYARTFWKKKLLLVK